MAKLYIAEHSFPTIIHSQINPPPMLPPVAAQTVTIAAASAQSSAFNARTRSVGIFSESDVSLEFGENPTATGNSLKIPSNQLVYFEVVPGQRLAVIANGASASSLFAAASTGIKRANISVGTSGDNTLVAAVTGKKIVVVNMLFQPVDDVTITFKSGSTNISGAILFLANSGVSSTDNVFGLLETVAGQALVMNLSGAVNVRGYLTYIEG